MRSGSNTQEGNVPYDGRFTFARIRFGVGLTAGSFRGGGRGLPPWAHDYPRAERNFMNILRETTFLQPYMDGGNIFTTDDRELTRNLSTTMGHSTGLIREQCPVW